MSHEWSWIGKVQECPSEGQKQGLGWTCADLIMKLLKAKLLFVGLEPSSACNIVTNHIHQANSSLPNISYSDKLSHLLQLVTCELCNVTRDLSLVPASSALHTSYIRLSVAKSKNDPGGTAWFLSSKNAVGQSCISLGGSRGWRCPSQIAHCLSGNKANWNLVSRFLNECMGCQGVVQSWRAPSRRRFWTQVISPAGLCVLMLSPRITLTRGMTNTTLLPGECHCNLAFMVVLFNRDSKLSIRMLNWALTVCVNFG